MIYNLFNLQLFCIATVLSWIVPRQWHAFVFLPCGLAFIHQYSPISVVLLYPFILLIGYLFIVQDRPKSRKNFSYNKARTQILSVTLWLFAWLPYGWYLQNYASFERKSFPYEILVLGLYNMARYYHVFYDVRHGQLPGVKTREFFAYVTFLPIAFGGPIELMQEFVHYQRKKLKIYWKRVGIHLAKAFPCALLAEFLVFYYNPFTFPFDDASLGNLLIYVFTIGWVIHLRLYSYIELTRAFACLMGYPFNAPNFQKVYGARSVASFWSRWNMSVGRWAMRYVLFKNFKEADTKSFIKILVLYFALIGAAHGQETQYTLWGLLMGLGIAWNLLYLYLKYKSKFWLLLDTRYFTVSLKRLLTILYIHFSCILLVPECEQIIISFSQKTGVNLDWFLFVLSIGW